MLKRFADGNGPVHLSCSNPSGELKEQFEADEKYTQN
jgi:hypothetical protein